MTEKACSDFEIYKTIRHLYLVTLVPRPYHGYVEALPQLC